MLQLSPGLGNRRGPMRRNYQVRLDDVAAKRLRLAARTRKVEPNFLLMSIVSIVLGEGLIDAVLDDRDERTG